MPAGPYDAAVRKSTPLDRLRRVVERRARPEPDLGIGRALGAVARGARRDERSVGAIVDVLLATLPERLLARVRVEGVRGDAVSLVAESASVRWALDRTHRAELEARLRAATDGRVQRIRLRLGTAQPTSDSGS